MEMIFLILVCLAEGLWETGAVSVTGVLHDKITVECVHSNAFTNVKYFCKGACDYEDVLITSRDEKDSTWKYSIKDVGNTFFVTIHDLTQDDAGTYWCGIERAGIDTYNKVVLTVTNGQSNASDRQQSNLKKLVFTGAVLGVVVMALAIVLLIFFRNRKRNIGGSPGKDQSTEHTTRSSMKEDAKDVNTSSTKAHGDENTIDSIFSSSNNQHQDTSGDDGGKFHSTNSNVTILSEDQKQPDGLFYTTVSFSKHTDCSTAIPTPATVTYSTVADISTEESTVYCNV